MTKKHSRKILELKDIEEKNKSPYFQKDLTLTLKDGNILKNNNISYLQVQGDLVAIFMEDGKVHYQWSTLKSFDEILPYPLFFRSHQSNIINILNVKKRMKGRERLLMSNGKEAKVSGSKREKTFSLLNKYN